MKYIVKKKKIYEIRDEDKTKKIKYDTYNEALEHIVKKKITRVTNKINNEIVSELVNTYRFIYSLPERQREKYSKELEDKIGSLAYKRKAKRLGKIELIEVCKKGEGKEGDV